MSRRRVQAGVTLTGFVIAAALSAACLIAAALSFTAGHHSDETRAAAAVSPTTTLAPGAAEAPVQPTGTSVTASASDEPLVLNKGADQKHQGETVAVGDCVAAVVAAPDAGAPVQKTACASTDSRYKITAKAVAGAHCPADADRAVAETLPGGATDTLCLDFNWVTGSCMNIADGSPTPVDCATAAPGRVRVVEIKNGTTDVNSCSDGDRGFVYNERRFVVCVTHY